MVILRVMLLHKLNIRGHKKQLFLSSTFLLAGARKQSILRRLFIFFTFLTCSTSSCYLASFLISIQTLLHFSSSIFHSLKVLEHSKGLHPHLLQACSMLTIQETLTHTLTTHQMKIIIYLV